MSSPRRLRRRVEVDGLMLSLREAAPKLGLTYWALEKRLQRGRPLDKPLQRHVMDR